VESRIQHLLPTIDSDWAGEALADWTITSRERIARLLSKCVAIG